MRPTIAVVAASIVVLSLLMLAYTAYIYLPIATTDVTKPVTQTQTSTVLTVPCPSSNQKNTDPNSFTVTVSYQGQSNATVTIYSALEASAAYLNSNCAYSGSGYFGVSIPWNQGPETVMVEAQKLDSGSGVTLTVNVGYGAASRSNSTTSSYGSTMASLSIAP